MRFWAILTALTAALTTTLTAGEPVVLVTGDGTGIFWDAESDTAIHVRIKKVGGEPGPNPPGPQPPPTGDDPPADPPEDTLAGRVKATASAIGDADGAALLASTYALLADQIEAGTVPDDNDKRAATVRDVTAEALVFIKRYSGDHHADWVAFDEWLTEQAGQLGVTGQLKTAAQWVKMLREIQSGLEAVAGKSIDLKQDEAAIFEDFGPLLRMLLRTLLDQLLERFFADAGAQAFEPEALVSAPAPTTFDDIDAMTWRQRAEWRDRVLRQMEARTTRSETHGSVEGHGREVRAVQVSHEAASGAN